MVPTRQATLSAKCRRARRQPLSSLINSKKKKSGRRYSSSSQGKRFLSVGYRDNGMFLETPNDVQVPSSIEFAKIRRLIYRGLIGSRRNALRCVLILEKYPAITFWVPRRGSLFRPRTLNCPASVIIISTPGRSLTGRCRELLS